MKLEKSPHVRTSGRAVFHGSWTRLKRPAVDDADSHSSFSSVSGFVNGERKDSRSHCRQDSKREEDSKRETERGERGKGFAVQRKRRRANRGEEHQQAAGNLPRFAWGLVKKLRGDAGGDRLGGNAINMETPQKQKKKRSRRSATSAFVPHGEGYVEFLNGWGVSQVFSDSISSPRAGSISNECTVSPFRVREPNV